MNGAVCALRTAAAAGVRICFANPGTTEMPLVRALGEVPEIRPVLGLFEGVCSGAADGFARMARQPALTLLHLGPGFANAIANLHNARRARTPLVNLIGDHATWHRPFDAPLTADIESLARPVSHWVRAAEDAKRLGEGMAEACAVSLAPPGRVATLIAPADCQWAEGALPVPPRSPDVAAPVEAARIEAIAGRLREAREAALFLGAPATRAEELESAGRIQAACGCRLICETFPARVDRGPTLPKLERLPYFPDGAREALASLSDLVIVAAPEPVTFFGYPGESSRIAPESCGVHTLARPEEDVPSALAALADALDAPARSPSARTPAAPHRPPLPEGVLTPLELGAALAAVLPEGAIVVDEAATSGLPFYLMGADGDAHTLLCLTGGAIGIGLPLATGAALACPDRPVVALQADGSAMYTVQALWTQAREACNVKTVLCSNRSYRILQLELARAGVKAPNDAERTLTELRDPELDWVALARGLGVPGVRVERAEELARALRRTLAEPGPFLIEACLP